MRQGHRIGLPAPALIPTPTGSGAPSSPWVPADRLAQLLALAGHPAHPARVAGSPKRRLRLFSLPARLALSRTSGRDALQPNQPLDRAAARRHHPARQPRRPWLSSPPPTRPRPLSTPASGARRLLEASPRGRRRTAMPQSPPDVARDADIAISGQAMESSTQAGGKDATLTVDASGENTTLVPLPQRSSTGTSLLGTSRLSTWVSANGGAARRGAAALVGRGT